MFAARVVLFIAALVMLAPVVVLAVECLAALLPPRRRWAGASRPRLAVLIPAHDEQAVIGQTLSQILPQLVPGDRLVVVADNCTDQTAAVAARGGAEVIERNEPERRGKGFALDFGVRHLQADPPEVLVMADADCRMEPGSLGALACQAVATGRPCQALYVMDLPEGCRAEDRVSAFAVRMKNLVRPLGASRMGAACFLTGTGMAFPWEVIRNAPLASGNIVEDMQLGIDLALAGHAPMLCEQAKVTGYLPGLRDAASSQRRRWEHGHLETILRQVPRLWGAAIRQARLGLAALALDLSVPPLSFLVLVLALGTAVLLPLSLWAKWWETVWVVVTGWILLGVAVVVAWARFARDILPFALMLSIPWYVLRKLPLYLSFWHRRQREWIRTGRGSSRSGP